MGAADARATGNDPGGAHDRLSAQLWVGSCRRGQACSGRLGIACLARDRLFSGFVDLAVMGRAARLRAASASGLADLGCAAAGATCRRGPDMGLADAGATARLGPCAFVGRTGRAAARVAPGRRAGTVMGSPPGSSPILGRAAGWGSRRTSRPFGAVVESARRAGLGRLPGGSTSGPVSGGGCTCAVGQRLGCARLGRVLGRAAGGGSGPSSDCRPVLGAAGKRVGGGRSVLGRAFGRAGVGTPADRRARGTSRSVMGSTPGVRRTLPGASARRSRAPTLEFAGAGLVGRGSSG